MTEKFLAKKSVEQVRNILVSIKPETSVEHVSFFFLFLSGAENREYQYRYLLEQNSACISDKEEKYII